MIWLFAVLSPLILTAFYYAFWPLTLSEKARVMPLQRYGISFLIDGFTSLLVSLCLALLISFAYQGYENGNVAICFLTATAFLLAVRPSDVVSQIHSGTFFSKNNKLALLKDGALFLVWLLELFVFNLRAFTLSSYSFRFTFSLLRVLAIAMVFLTFIYLPSYLRDRKNEGFSRLQVAKRGLLIAGLSGVLIFVITVTISPATYLTGYPFSGLYTDQGNPFVYYNLFEALKNGQLAFVQTPSPELAALSNPYSYDQREGLSYLWDVAYYQGNYYAYQGLSPVLFIMFPVYWLSGCNLVPNGLFILSICFLGFGFGFCYLSLLLVELFCHHFEWRVWLFLTLSGLFSSLWLSFVSYRWSDWKYLIPFAFAVACAIWFLAMVLQGYLRKKHRVWLFALAAFFYLEVLSSAPEVGWCGLMGLAPLFASVFEKGTSWRKKLLIYLPTAILLACGSSLLMVYNALRFGNVFENGRNYLLTSFDPKDITLTWPGMLSALFHYGFEPFAFSRTLPFFGLSSAHYVFDGLVLDSGTIGVVFQPYFWGMFLTPWACQSSRDKVGKYFLILNGASCLLIAYYFYCFYGASIYGMVALWPFLGVGVLATYLALSNAILENENRRWMVPALAFVCFLGVFLSLNYAVNKTDGLQEGPMGLLGKLILEMFSL